MCSSSACTKILAIRTDSCQKPISWPQLLQPAPHTRTHTHARTHRIKTVGYCEHWDTSWLALNLLIQRLYSRYTNPVLKEQLLVELILNPGKIYETIFAGIYQNQGTVRTLIIKFYFINWQLIVLWCLWICYTYLTMYTWFTELSGGLEIGIQLVAWQQHHSNVSKR